MTTLHPLSTPRASRATIAAMLSLAQALQPVATEAIKATQTKETTNVSRPAR